MAEPLLKNAPDALPPFSIDQTRRLRALESQPSDALLVHEIYRSLQGESTFAGLPCLFVRLSVCHLRCNYCDSAHAFHKGIWMSVEEVAEEVLRDGCRLVEVTGGEPLLQAETFPLLTRLCDEGRTVLLETSGSLDIQYVDPRVRIILDFKTPGSGEAAANLWANVAFLKPTDEVKFVVSDHEDFQWMIATIDQHNLLSRCAVIASPVHDRVEGANLARWILESRRPIRLQIQLHKILWGPRARGV